MRRKRKKEKEAYEREKNIERSLRERWGSRRREKERLGKRQ
jgi:hypothetical protein